MGRKKYFVCGCIRCVFFVCGFMALFWFFNQILMVKRFDGTIPALALRQQEEDTVDVLFLGSSRIGMDISTDVLWRDYGMANYVLWGSVQPFWNSYYMLQEALKTQNPQAVILEVSAAGYEYEYQDDERQIVNTAGMRFSLNKWEAVKASASKERWVPLFLGLPLYHGRYTDLSADDCSYFPWKKDRISHKGAGRFYGTMDGQIKQTPDLREPAEIYEKEEIYLRRIIEECKKNHISIMLISTPVPDVRNEKPYDSTVSQIADEYGIPYYNFNELWEMTGLHITDFADVSHMNVYGARKFSKCLGTILKQHFTLKDRRGDSSYDSWNINADELKNESIRCANDVERYFEELADCGKAIIAIKHGEWEKEQKPNASHILNYLSAMGFDAASMSSYTCLAYLPDVTDERAYWKELTDTTNFADISSNDTQFGVNIEDGVVNIVINGQKKYGFESAGIVLLVYDTNTKAYIDAAAFLQSNDWNLMHWIP